MTDDKQACYGMSGNWQGYKSGLYLKNCADGHIVWPGNPGMQKNGKCFHGRRYDAFYKTSMACRFR